MTEPSEQGDGATIPTTTTMKALSSSSLVMDAVIGSSGTSSNDHVTRKIDPITALQDAIDGLSLAMFEALRGLRDAVAPESGNLGNAAIPDQNSSQQQQQQQQQSATDLDDLWHAYRSGDPDVVAMMHRAAGSNNATSKILIHRREEFVRLHAKMEMEKDVELVRSLASTVLEKSAQIDDQVEHVLGPAGMNRTRAEQMTYIQELIQANQEAAAELDTAYAEARIQRDTCREFVLTRTNEALGISEH